MRVFALSDIHIDYSENRNWLAGLSVQDYTNDVLILAGDISDLGQCVELAFRSLGKRFREVMYVPGNHDLWIRRSGIRDSLASLDRIKAMAYEHGIHMGPRSIGSISFVPLYGWYDYSFGTPGRELLNMWMDFSSCTWPQDFSEQEITRFFISMNERHLATRNEYIISFSHFMPRVDLMPSIIPAHKRILYPVLGTALLEEQIRKLGSDIHIYGHTHVNAMVRKEGILYVNNAFGYPTETRITRKKLVCVFES
jgi:predicted phosphodiesterase